MIVSLDVNHPFGSPGTSRLFCQLKRFHERSDGVTENASQQIQIWDCFA
jgi:hypothetical protein